MNQPVAPLKTSVQSLFDNLIMAYDDDIKVTTAKALARDLGVKFEVEDYDH
jgi:hypothetical protein